MPELRSGARQGHLRSKNPDNVPVPSRSLGQAENPILPAQNRRRGGAGRGRGGNAAAIAKRTSATPARPVVGVRGRGAPLIDLDPDQPCEILPQVVEGAIVEGAQNLVLNQAAHQVAGKNIAMNGGSAEKVIGVEDESATAPVPERVWLFIILVIESKVVHIYLPSCLVVWQLFLLCFIFSRVI